MKIAEIVNLKTPGARMQAIREFFGKSHQEVALDIGVYPMWLREVELGLVHPRSRDVYQRVAALFRISPEWVLTGKRRDGAAIFKTMPKSTFSDLTEEQAEEMKALLSIWAYDVKTMPDDLTQP